MITAALNKMAHRIRRAFPSLTWGESFRLAIRTGEVIDHPATMAETSVFGRWTPVSHRALAGHFWALKLGYREMGDEGRSFWAGRIAQTLFATWEEGVQWSFSACISATVFGEQALLEVVEFFRASAFREHTARVLKLPNTDVVHRPHWSF